MSQILTAEQLAEALSLNAETIRRLTRSGELPHHRISPGVVRYSLDKVLAETQVAEGSGEAPKNQWLPVSAEVYCVGTNGDRPGHALIPVTHMLLSTIGGRPTFFMLSGHEAPNLYSPVSGLVWDVAGGFCGSLEDYVSTPEWKQPREL